ncbi:MAG TPA: PGF-CTERM sorting domain-containing protein [Methanocella sp.]|nr:PGF-CTERM sorting domain-containing protein [Methanocella sp.]
MRLFAIVSILFAIIVPLHASAQSTMNFADVKGTVYNQATPANGAKVTLYSYDGKKPGDTQGTVNVGADGTFIFKNIMFDPAKPVSYIVRAEREGNTAYALVLYYPANGPNQPAEVREINIDIGSTVSAMRGDAAVTVWSTASSGMPVGQNLALVLGADLKLYSVDPNTNNMTAVTFSDTPKTDNNGLHTFPALPYGKYYVTAEKNGKSVSGQYFWVTQQENTVNVVSNIDVPKATATPTNGTSSGGAWIPGFETAAALTALAGVIILQTRRKQ